MTTALLAVASLAASGRVVTGRLFSFNEVGQTNLGHVRIAPGAIKPPADASLMYLADTHAKPVKGIGTGLYAQEQPDGMYASWHVPEGPEGDALLAELASPDPTVPRRLSIEVDDIKIRGGVIVDGRLHGAARVPAGAFASATLLAEDVGLEDLAVPAVIEESDEDEIDIITDAPEAPEAVVVTTATGEQTTYTPEAAPAEDNPEGSDMTNTLQAGAQAPAIPATLLAGAPAAQVAPRPVASKSAIIGAIARARLHMATNDDMTLLASLSPRLTGDAATVATTLLAALNNINLSGGQTGSANGQVLSNIGQPNWLGIVNPARTYTPQFMSLGIEGSDISLHGKVGFDVKRGTSGSEQTLAAAATAGEYAGAGAAVASDKFFSGTRSSSLHRFAKGEAFDRAWFDLAGGEQFIAAALALLDEEANYWADDKARALWVTTAGTAVAPKALTAILGADNPLVDSYPPALARVVQGVVALRLPGADGRSDVPTFAIVNQIAYEQLAYYGFVNDLNKFEANVGTNRVGSIDGLSVVVGDIGIDDTAAAIVGCDYALQFDTLPGGVLHVDALELANGNVDRAVHAYLQTFVAREQAAVLVGTADV